MKFWILEDSADTAEILKSRLRACRAGAPTKLLATLEEAERAVDEIDDSDVVFVDSQVPAERSGATVTDAGERFVARLRARGCTCRVFWHSVSPSTSLSSLGVERVKPKDVCDALFTSDEPLRRAALAEEWRRGGEELLARLNAAQAPLSEFEAMSALCQGYLAVVGAARRFENEVAYELQKFEGGRECLASARGYLVRALDAAAWLADARDGIAEALRRHGAGEEDYWLHVGGGLEELKPDVAAVRVLYERLKRSAAGGAGVAGEWHESVVGAHRGMQSLFARRYL